MTGAEAEKGGDESSPWLRELEACGALTRGHFKLSSGLHSPAYVQCARLIEDPRRARRAGEALAGALREELGRVPTSVLAPAMGAILIGHEVAVAWGVAYRFSERDDEGKMVLRRGFELSQGEELVIIEDVVTSGRSTLETAELASSLGAEVVAVGSILDRTGGTEPFDVPFVSLAHLDLPTYEAEECPMCAKGEAVVKPGSRPG